MAAVEMQVNPAVAPEARPRPRSRNWILLLAILAMVLSLAFFGWRWWQGRNFAHTDDAFVDGDLVPVLSRVSGYVQQVGVNENDLVKEGQILVVVDPRELQQRLVQAEAELSVAENAGGGAGQAGAQAQAASASAASALADAASTQANADRARADVERLKPLAEEQIVSRQQFETAESNLIAAEAELRAATQKAQAAAAQARAAQAGIGGAEGQEAAARAAVEQARLQLAYHRISAPIAGVVARKNVQVGQLVSPGQALMTVVPLARVWVTANLKETQLAGVEPGDPVEITVDAYPGLVFHGHVESISPATGSQFSLLPPENATGNFTKVVQRVPVRVSLDGDNPQVDLRPGLSSEVIIQKDS